MQAAGTKVVGVTNPRKAGQTVDSAAPRCPCSYGGRDEGRHRRRRPVVFVPPQGTKAAVIEAIDAAIPLVIVITEGIPVHDTAEFWAYATAKGNTTRIVGPNCPGWPRRASQRGHHPGRHPPRAGSAWSPSPAC